MTKVEELRRKSPESPSKNPVIQQILNQLSNWVLQHRCLRLIGRCWLQNLSGTGLGLQPSSFVWLMATRFVTAGEPLLGPLPHLSPFPLQSVTDQNNNKRSISYLFFRPMLSYGHNLHTRAHLRMRFFLHCRETEYLISGHLNSRLNTKHMYTHIHNWTKARFKSNVTTKYKCTCCSSLHTCVRV